MTRLRFSLFLLCAVRASAVPAGSVDAHAAAATGYAGEYLETISLSLADDPRFASRLLDSFELHLRSVAAMTAPRAVADYLEVAVVGASSGQDVKAALGKEAMGPQRAAALMLAHVLARPGQFREVLDGLEARRAGLGKETAKLLRETSGRGDRRLIAALRARGAKKVKGAAPAAYARFGQLERIFDASGTGLDASMRVTDERPQRSGLDPARE